MEHKIELTEKQLDAVKRRSQVAAQWQERSQVAQDRFREAQEAVTDLVSVLASANGVDDYDFAQSEVKDGVLILRQEKADG